MYILDRLEQEGIDFENALKFFRFYKATQMSVWSIERIATALGDGSLAIYADYPEGDTDQLIQLYDDEYTDEVWKGRLELMKEWIANRAQ